MIESLLAIVMIGTGAQADEWPVLWPTVPPVVQQLAPIESTLAADDSAVVLDLITSSGTAVRIVLEPPLEPKKTLTRYPGPTWPLPHGGCQMCHGNHILTTHKQSLAYLYEITSAKWQVLHDNLHNDPGFTGTVGTGREWINYSGGTGYSSRRGIFGRRR